MPRARSTPALPRPAATRPYRAEGRERQKQETRARILDCAIRLFSERGFDGASVRDISAAAGVTHAVIRLHFGGKERLWRAALDRLFERQDEELGAGGREAPWPQAPDEQREQARRYVHYCARHPEHVRLMVQASLRDTPRVRWLARTHVARVQAPLVRAFHEATRRNRREALAIPSVLYSVVAAAQMVFALGAEIRHVYGVDVTDPDFMDVHAGTVERIVEGLFGCVPGARAPRRRSRGR